MYDLVITYSLHINLKIKKKNELLYHYINCLALLPSVEIILYPSVPIYK